MICRPRDHLDAFSRLYPGAWRVTAEFVRDKGKDLPDWPDWCYLPMAGSYAVVSGELRSPSIPLSKMSDVARHAALAAWRLTQGIYRFDPAVYDAVRDTPVVGEIPHQVLYRMPEWCIYVETPGLSHMGSVLHGAFAHLEHDVNAARPELRFLLDCDTGLVPLVLHLGPWSLSESLERMCAQAQVHSPAGGLRVSAVADSLRAVAEPLLSLLLYVCSQAGEIGSSSHRPARPSAKATKRGLQFFPADKPLTWDVGLRLGSALRLAYLSEQSSGSGSHGGPRPHVRRAHWHGFRSGPRLRPDGSEIQASDRPFDLRWLPPIAVNLSDVNELPATVRPVK